MKEVHIKENGLIHVVGLIESVEDVKELLKQVFGDSYDELDEEWAVAEFNNVPQQEVMVLEGWRTLGSREYPLLNSYKKTQIL